MRHTEIYHPIDCSCGGAFCDPHGKRTRRVRFALFLAAAGLGLLLSQLLPPEAIFGRWWA